ncbi:MAG: M48 family metalloprotease [Verrucomicrobiota bacterium]
MNSQDYASFVRGLEVEAEAHPHRFRRKTLRIARRGNWFLALVWGSFVAAFLGGLWICVLTDSEVLAWIVLLFFFFNGLVLYSPFAVKIESPNGLRLKRKDVPKLFAEMDAVRKALRIRKIHRVWLNEELNAGAAQISRVARIGPLRNELLLGLPLLETVSLDEFRGILAHELAHLARRHGHFLARMTGMREGWSVIAEEEQPFMVRILLGKFARKYWPTLKAHLDVQGRLEEQEADQLASTQFDPGALISGKARTTMMDHLVMEDYFEGLQRLNVANEEAPEDAVSQLVRQLAGPFEATAIHRSLVKGLADDMEVDETHPSLRKSLTAMGWESSDSIAEDATRIQDLLTPVSPSASEELLGHTREDLRKEMDARWQEENRELWSESHRFAKGQEQALERIEARLQKIGSLTLEDALIRAKLTRELAGSDQAIPLFRDVLKQDPTCAEACLELGLCLVQDDDVAGAVLLEMAMETDPSYTFAAAEALAKFLRQRDDDSAMEWKNRMLEASDQLKESENERMRFSHEDTLLAHQFSPERIEELQDAFSKMDSVAEVWAARKQLHHLQRPPMMVLGVKRKPKPWWKNADEAQWAEIESGLLVKVPTIEHLHVAEVTSGSRILQKFESLGEDARVFG